MLFKDIKANYPVYILDKQEVTFKQGKATNITFPRMEMTANGTQMVVDVTIEVDGRTATYSIPDHLAITYAGNLVLATEKNLLIKDVEAINEEANHAISTIDQKKEAAKRSSELLIELNPVFKAKQENEKRFSEIETSVSDMKKSMVDMKDMLTNFINEFKK